MALVTVLEDPRTAPSDAQDDRETETDPWGRRRCVGCADLSISMKRKLPDQELLITVRRTGKGRPHRDDCVMDALLREFALQFIP